MTKENSQAIETLLIEAEQTYNEGNLVKSSEYLAQILTENNNVAKAWHLSALIMYNQKNWEKTSEFIKRALLEEPNNVSFMLVLAEALKAQGSFDAAKTNLLQAFELEPENLDIIAALGQVELELNHLDESYKYFKYYIDHNQTNADIFNNLGCISAIHNLNDEALAYFNKAIKLNPNSADSLNNLGNIYLRQGHSKKAKTSFQKALTINPKHADAYNNIGNIYKQEKAIDKAITAFQKAIAINQNHVDAQSNLGITLLNIKQTTQAAIHLQKAYQMAPNDFNVVHNLALCLYYQENYDAAKKYFKQANSIQKNCMSMFYLGKIQGLLKNLPTALEYVKEAAILEPNNIDILYHIGKYYQQNNEYSDAKQYYNKILTLNPNHLPSICAIMYLDCEQCNWNAINKQIKQFNKAVKTHDVNSHNISPFEVLALPVSQSLYKTITTIEVKKILEYATDFPKYKYNKQQKIKIGYLSPDFNYHPVGMMLNNIFQHHNRDKFHITGYNLVATADNPFNKTIKSSCDNFVDLFNNTAKQAADLINNDNIDILVDLAGYTTHAKPAILALQPAPIQCHWLGFAESLHAPFIQYFIAHKTIITKENRQHFSENIAFLPDTSIILASQFNIPKCQRETFNIAKDKFVYCNFSQPYRINAEVFNMWMSILEKTPNSILWLYVDNDSQQNNLIAAAQSYGITTERLLFTKERILTKDWYHQIADVWLDTTHIASGTGILLSLLADLPAVSMAGNSSQARTSASILTCADLKELVCSTEQEYIELAVSLYENKTKLKQIKNKIQQTKNNMPVFKPKQLINAMENAFLAMLNNYDKGNHTDIVI